SAFCARRPHPAAPGLAPAPLPSTWRAPQGPRTWRAGRPKARIMRNSAATSERRSHGPKPWSSRDIPGYTPYSPGGRAMAERTRASWDEYFMAIARQVATRSTCDRKHVGAVIVRDKMILTTGYNGSIRGLPHYDEEGHLMEDGHCVRTVHAEANAIVQAARSGVRLDAGDIYVNASPYFDCFKLIANAGLRR